MYMEAIKQSEDKGIMMGTTITIKLKGQSVIFFFLHLLLSFGFLLFIKKHYPISTLPEHLHSTSLSHAKTT